MTQIPDSLDFSRLLEPEDGGSYDDLSAVNPWDDTRGVNELIKDDAWDLTTDGAWVVSNGYVAANFNGDDVFDRAWRGDGNGGWETSSNGQTWFPSADPTHEMLAWELSH